MKMNDRGANNCSKNMGIACKQITNFFLFLFILIGSASAQPRCKVQYYSTEQGLSHQAVTAMFKDSEGFMWFGSWDGINRFDGRGFVSYKSSPGDMSQLGNDRIDQIMEDQSGHLWIQAYDRQIYRFDKKIQQFFPLASVINLDDSKKIAFGKILTASSGLVWLESVNEGIFCVPQAGLSKERIIRYGKGLSAEYWLPSNTINFFHEDIEHQIWIGTPEGLSCLVRSTDGNYKNNRSIPINIGSSINLTSFDEDAAHLYFSTADGSLIIYEKSSKRFVVTKIANNFINALICSKANNAVYVTTTAGEVITFKLADQRVLAARYHSAESLFSIYEDRNGVLWIEPEKVGVIRYDPSNGSFRYFSQKVEDPYHSIGNRFKVFEDNNGIVWVNMKGGGFGYYNTAKSSLDYFLNAADVPEFRLPSVVYNVYYDSAGIIWLRVRGRELVKIIFQGNEFKQQRLVDAESILADNEIRGIFYDNKNKLWLGAKSGKLYVEQNGRRIKGVFVDEPVPGIGQVYSILQDSHGNIWLATKNNGLFKARPVKSDETKYKLTNYLADEHNDNGLTSNQIYSLLEDKQGRIWVGTFDQGLVLAVQDGDDVKFLHAQKALKNYPKENFQKIRHMAADSAGNIWIGTTDGLLVLNAKDGSSPPYRFKSFSKIPGDKESLGNNDIQFIYRDSKNRMWLATSGGGFCQAIGHKPYQSLKFRNYTTKDGLPNDYVLSCAEDKTGNLWIATENGLSRLNPDTKIFRNYDSYDGLPRLGFSEASACQRLPDGSLVFGTTDGYLRFNPGHISSTRIYANIALTNLQINNENAGPGTNGTIVKEDINYISKLTLKYDENTISIDYAILDQRAANRQAFAYRLIGFDSAWIDDRQQRRATYTNLQPAHYLFEVKSLSTDLYSNKPYKSLQITILPPPWKTVWAYILYVIFIALLLYFIRQYALAMIRLRNKIVVEQKLAALKLNFFTNVSHELRTPLTLIVNPLEQLSKKEKLSPEGVGYLDIARKNASRMVRFINQLLDLRKVQSDKGTLHISRVEIVSFVKKIGDHFTEAARSKRIKLDVLSNQKELNAWVDAEKLDVVVYNLLGNAIKFTPPGKLIRVLIKLIPEEQSLSIAVNDQGCGVPMENLEKIFEIFQGGDNFGSRELKGTGIGLALSREFVNLHDGKIWAENNADGGLTVTVKLKIGVEHYSQERVAFVDLPKATPLFEKPLEQLILPSNTVLSKDPLAPLVLLVEDNDELRSFIRAQLSGFYRVEMARDGEEGLQKAVDLIPDLIISDIMMPGMNGIQMLDKVKNDINTSHIPVVLLSAKCSIESQIEGLKYGADYYITKPFNNEFLMASIDNLLRQRKKLFEVLVERKNSIELSPSPVVITSKDEIFLKEVIHAVEERMEESGFNIESLAGTMAMNSNTFYKKFKSLTGLTPVEFVRDMRLQRAKQLLDAGGSNVSEVAYAVGFNNPKYFSTCFKDKYYVSPSDYLKAKAT